MQRLSSPTARTVAKFIASGLLAAVGSASAHDDNDRHNRIETRLKSYNEVPAVSSAATGHFKARIVEAQGVDAGHIEYELSFSGLEGTVTQSHIHLGQHSVNGGIMVWLCESATNPSPSASTPACPQSGTVQGVIQAAEVIGPAGQGISALEFDEVVKAIRAGKAYVNVHSSKIPSGELRGQLGRHDRD